MRPDEVRTLIALLPEGLRPRAELLRPYTFRGIACAQCVAIGETVAQALTAAHYDDLAVAAHLIGRAEQVVAEHAHALVRPGRRPQEGVHGQVRRYRSGGAGGGGAGSGTKDGPGLVAATDASWKGMAGGYAYVTSDGRWGLRSHSRLYQDPTGPSLALVNELRAIEFLLAAVDAPGLVLTVLVDSSAALGYLARWRSGDTARMPRGYSLRPRSGGLPTLVRLAERVGQTSAVFQHVKGHDGHPLNEAADSLSAMARRSVAESFDLADRAASLVEAFLRDWHAALPAR